MAVAHWSTPLGLSQVVVSCLILTLVRLKTNANAALHLPVAGTRSRVPSCRRHHMAAVQNTDIACRVVTVVYMGMAIYENARAQEK